MPGLSPTQGLECSDFIKYAGSPVGVLTPNFVGQRCQDTTTGLFYVAQTTASSGWALQAVIARNSQGQTIGVSDGSTTYPLAPSYGYHFHGYAPDQYASADVKFWDRSGQLNDATFQTNLTAANAWANAGFLTQADPSGAGNLLLTAIPATSWSYSAGDSLFIFWKGMATPEGSDMPIMGNTTGSSANGFRIMVTSAGKAKFNCYQASGALSNFGGTSGNTVFEAATSHSFAVAVDGVTGKHCYWGDGSRDSSYGSGFLTLGSNGIIDTLSATTIKHGGDGGTTASVQNGVACKTQALVILAGRRGLGTPVVADLDLLVANLHRSPRTLVGATSW